jgi:lambda repressor-like predicted transcriptional regulator
MPRPKSVPPSSAPLAPPSDSFVAAPGSVDTNPVRVARLKAGVSLRQLSRLTGLSKALIGNLEAGRYLTAMESIQIAKVLGCEPEDLCELRAIRVGHESAPCTTASAQATPAPSITPAGCGASLVRKGGARGDRDR